MPKLSAKQLLERDWEHYDLQHRYNPTYFDKRAPSPLESPQSQQLSPDLRPSPPPSPSEYCPDHYDDKDGFVDISARKTQPSPQPKTAVVVVDLTNSSHPRHVAARVTRPHPSPQPKTAAARVTRPHPSSQPKTAAAVVVDLTHSPRPRHVAARVTRPHPPETPVVRQLQLHDTPHPQVLNAHAQRTSTPPLRKPPDRRTTTSKSKAVPKTEAHSFQHAPKPTVIKTECKPTNQPDVTSLTPRSVHACLPPSTRATKLSQHDANAPKPKVTQPNNKISVKREPSPSGNELRLQKKRIVGVLKDEHASDLRTFMNSIRASVWLHAAERVKSAHEQPINRRRTSRRLAKQRSQQQPPPLKINSVDTSVEPTLRAWLRVVLSEALAAYWTLSHPGARTYCSAIENGHIRHALHMVAMHMGVEWTVINRVRTDDGDVIRTKAQFELYKSGTGLISVSEESVLEKVYDVVNSAWCRYLQAQNKRRVSTESRNLMKRDVANEGKDGAQVSCRVLRSQSSLSTGKTTRSDASSGQSGRSAQSRTSPRLSKAQQILTRAASRQLNGVRNRGNHSGLSPAKRITRASRRRRHNRSRRP